MKFSRRERIYAVFIGVLVGILLLDRMVVEPGRARWEKIQTLVVDADREIAQAERVLARQQAVRSQWETLQGRMRHISLDEVLYFVDHLWGLASKAGTSFQKTEPLKRVDPRGDFNEISYEVRLLCDIRSLTRFVYELDASPEMLKVRRLHVTAKPGGQALDVDVQISTLEPAAPAAPPLKKAASHDDAKS
jgi:hypothetical protein